MEAQNPIWKHKPIPIQDERVRPILNELSSLGVRFDSRDEFDRNWVIFHAQVWFDEMDAAFEKHSRNGPSFLKSFRQPEIFLQLRKDRQSTIGSSKNLQDVRLFHPVTRLLSKGWTVCKQKRLVILNPGRKIPFFTIDESDMMNLFWIGDRPTMNNEVEDRKSISRKRPLKSNVATSNKKPKNKMKKTEMTSNEKPLKFQVIEEEKNDPVLIKSLSKYAAGLNIDGTVRFTKENVASLASHFASIVIAYYTRLDRDGQKLPRWGDTLRNQTCSLA